MSEEQRPDPVVSKRGLSDRSRELLAGTRRTDELPGEKSPHRVIRSLWWPLLYVVLALGAVDFALAPLVWAARSDLPTEPLITVCIGLVTVQAFLIAMGLVFGRESLAIRLFLSGALLLIVFACGTAGYFSSVFTAEVDLGGQRWFALAGMFWCGLIALLVGLVTPMCFVRGVLGWRLTNPDEVRERSRWANAATLANRYSLLDLMVLTSFIGLTLGVPRFTYDRRAGRYDDEDFWFCLVICAASAMFAGALLLILAWRQLRPYSEIQPWWTLVTCLGWSLVITMGVMLPFHGLVELAIGWLIWLQALICGAVVGLMVSHVHGWRWERAGRPLRAS